MSRRPFVVATIAMVLLVGAGCTSPDDNGSGGGGGGGSASGPDFGSLTAPCGEGDGTATVDAAQNGGGGTGTIKVGTPTDKGFEIQPGLNIEMEDAAKAFIGWCNDQGGIQGLKLELVELDGQVLQVPAVMEQACEEVFSLVGGGLVLDNQEFPRFHECGMIDIAGYTASTEKAMSNGMVQPLPNPSNVKPTGWFEWAKENNPNAISRAAIMYGNVGSIETLARQDQETMDEVGGFTVVDQIVYNTTGESNWAPFAQRLKDNNVGFLTFVGQPANLASLLRSMDEIGYRPELIMQQANHYDAVLTQGAGPLADGVIVRSFYAPLEERDNPAIAKYLDNMARYSPSGKVAGLGIQTTSAYLLFVTAANACLDADGGVLERDCVLREAKKITAWDGGGLHATSNPSTNTPSNCELLLVVRNGEFVRLFPETGSADDNGNGWHCRQPGLAQLTGDYGNIQAGVDASRPR
jgi:ABC-type branched-subunit amino acid transport system substrate-binding protein